MIRYFPSDSRVIFVFLGEASRSIKQDCVLRTRGQREGGGEEARERESERESPRGACFASYARELYEGWVESCAGRG